MKIAWFCIPAAGHTNPTLAVVRRLTEKGHAVRPAGTTRIYAYFRSREEGLKKLIYISPLISRRIQPIHPVIFSNTGQDWAA